MNEHTSPLFRGCATALVTPFRHGELDLEAFIRLLRAQILAGVDALVVAGTTGESPTLLLRARGATTRAVRWISPAWRRPAGVKVFSS